MPGQPPPDAPDNPPGRDAAPPKPHYHGHRQRLRERFLATDGEGMPTTNCSNCCSPPPSRART